MPDPLRIWEAVGAYAGGNCGGEQDLKKDVREVERCSHCGDIMPQNIDRYRYCSDLCALLARDRLNKMCQRERWDELMPEEPCEILLRNPHSLDG